MGQGGGGPPNPPMSSNDINKMMQPNGILAMIALMVRNRYNDNLTFTDLLLGPESSGREHTDSYECELACFSHVVFQQLAQVVVRYKLVEESLDSDQARHLAAVDDSHSHDEGEWPEDIGTDQLQIYGGNI